MNNQVEEWRPVDGYGGAYEVSNLARVRSLPRLTAHNHKVAGGILTPRVSDKGYCVVTLCCGKERRVCNIYRLLALAFLPNPEGKPGINHIDGNKLNNSLGNLGWCTQAENNRHAVTTGLHRAPLLHGEQVHNAKLTVAQAREIKALCDAGVKHKIIAAQFGIGKTHVSAIKCGKLWVKALEVAA